MSSVLVFAEVTDGALHELVGQCMTAARTIAGDSGQVTAALLGCGVSELPAKLASLGADRVAVVDDPRLGAYVGELFLAALRQVFEASPARVVLMPASTVGGDLAPALASALRVACVLDADSIAIENGRIVAGRVGFDRKVRTIWCASDDRALVVTLRDGAAPEPGPAATRTASTIPVGTVAWPEVAGRMIRREVARKTANLRQAKIVVAAGAGVGNPEGLALVRELANALGAELGGTRAVVDAGWLPADRQIGQTGATVRPDLYIACGISGAIQHRVGMMDSRTVVAINTDPNASIFRVAHYRIVGDLRIVIPKLLKLLRS